MTPWLDDGDVRLYLGDNLDVLRTLPDKSVHMCCTSPPFYGLRDYGTGSWEGGTEGCDHIQEILHNMPEERPRGWDGAFRNTGTPLPKAYGKVCGKCGARRVDKQIGLEETPDQWVQNLVAVFREVRRVLRDDGTLWVEIGDSYASGSLGDSGRAGATALVGNTRTNEQHRTPVTPGTKPKDLLGQPWLLAFALRADGWYLRSEIIWARPNPMPESVTDRPTKSHSTVFLLSKNPRYFYDADAIRQPSKDPEDDLRRVRGDMNGYAKKHTQGGTSSFQTKDIDAVAARIAAGANARSVWQIPTQPTPFAHFATWPEQLCRRMILAGTSERGCCPECGAAWTRDVESASVNPWSERKASGAVGGNPVLGNGASHAPPGQRDSPNQRALASKGMSHYLGSVRTHTGWSPSCDCTEGEPGLFTVPCTVLDPFAGSATTNLVARNHGRHSIGIELNEDYLKIAAKRLQQLSLLA